MFFVFVFFGGSCRNVAVVVVVVVDFLRFVSRAFLGFDFYVFRVPRSVRAPNASFAVRMKTKRSARAAKQKKLASVTGGTTTHTHHWPRQRQRRSRGTGTTTGAADNHLDLSQSSGASCLFGQCDLSIRVRVGEWAKADERIE